MTIPPPSAEAVKRYGVDRYGDVYETEVGQFVEFTDYDALIAQYAILRRCYDGQNDLGNRIIAERDALTTRLARAEEDAARYRWLLEDHPSREVRERQRSICQNLAVTSYSAASTDIDLAMAEIALAAAKGAGK